MALDATDIPDRPGAAVYMLYDGTVTQQRSLEKLKKDVEVRMPDRQIIILSVKERNGEYIRNFYALAHHSMPYILIVRDNDELAFTWSGPHIPTAEHVAHTLRTESA